MNTCKGAVERARLDPGTIYCGCRRRKYDWSHEVLAAVFVENQLYAMAECSIYVPRADVACENLKKHVAKVRSQKGQPLFDLRESSECRAV